MFNSQRPVNFLPWRWSQWKLASQPSATPSLPLWGEASVQRWAHSFVPWKWHNTSKWWRTAWTQYWLYQSETDLHSRKTGHLTSSENLSCPAIVSVHHIQYRAHWGCWKSADHYRWYWGWVPLDSNYFLLWSGKLMRGEKEIRAMPHSL